jgi:hypothetical protein
MTMTEVRSHTNGRIHGPEMAAPHEQRNGYFVNALQDAVRENPISAALVGMGVLWMFMGGSNTTLFGGGGRKSIFRTAVLGAEQVGHAVRDNVGSSVGRAADVAAGTASQVADAVRQATAAAGDVASRTVGQAADSVSSAYDATTDVTSRAAEKISNATITATMALQNTGAKWGTNLSDLFDRQPLLLGAVGLAIGAGIASSIPMTEAEKKVMGETSDFVRDTVSEKVAQVKDMADVALLEAKAQGLTPEAAGKALHTLGERLAP